jgi:hypothetical protein
MPALITCSNRRARLAEIDRRRAALHRRSSALKAPGRGATEAEEQACAAACDQIDAAFEELEREMARAGSTVSP